MFDSPIADMLPGQLGRYGFPYHGLLEFPGLKDAISCPLSTVKLTTHAGREIYPFVGSSRSASRLGLAVRETTRLWRDSRSADEPETESGQDWSGYVVLSRYGRLALARLAADGVYSAPSGNHLYTLAGASLRIFDMLRVERARSSGVWGSITIPLPDAPRIVDTSVDGSAILSYEYVADASRPLRKYTLQGSYPEISCSVITLMDVDETRTDGYTLEGTTAADAGVIKPYAVWALEGYGNPTVGWYVDQVGGDPDWAYHSESESRQLVAAWLEHDGVGQVWLESSTVVDASYMFDYALISHVEEGNRGENPVFEHAIWTTTKESRSESTTTIRLMHGGVSVGEIELRATSYFYDFDGRKVGLGGGDPPADIHIVEHERAIRFEGIDVLARFPRLSNPDLSQAVTSPGPLGYGPFLYDTTTPPGESKRLYYSYDVYRYSENLVALRLRAVYLHTVDGVDFDIRAETLIGPAIYRGRVDSDVRIFAGLPTLYGAGCPKTGKIARNYEHPVSWV